jgi:hypothetical protein
MAHILVAKGTASKWQGCYMFVVYLLLGISPAGKYPKEDIQHSKPDESLKSRLLDVRFLKSLVRGIGIFSQIIWCESDYTPSGHIKFHVIRID